MTATRAGGLISPGQARRLAQSAQSAQTPTENFRKPATDADLKYWLQNMVWHHRYSKKEITAATGLTTTEINAALKRFNISPENRPKRPKNAPLLMLPYPGGRHPRIGFLDGAIRPQRETKFSVFTPWDEKSYVVVDLPEAIWSNLGLTYLAHTHVPTIWTKMNATLKKLEWTRHKNGSLECKRRLPNGIAFGAKSLPTRQGVRMQLWLKNGTTEKLTDLRVQICVLLARAAGFDRQTNKNKQYFGRYAVCRSADGKRWIITAWEHFHRGWANNRCPCLHSDPKFPDCPPGTTQRLNGWLSFYEGSDIRAEIRRIEKLNWRTNPQFENNSN